MTRKPSMAAVAIDGGDLALGEGLVALLRPALMLVEPGGIVALLSKSPAAREDLPSWCRAEHHEYRGVESIDEKTDRHLIVRGSLPGPRPFPDPADATTGFAPRGALVEPGGPPYPYTLLDADRVAPPEVAALYAQAVKAQWSAERDIAWSKLKPKDGPVERAVGQVMTFLAENELSALYVPSKFVSRLHPAYAEVAMFLATQMNDEARHIEVFLRRARAGGGLGVSSVTTAQSLLFLLQLEDFSEASFMLSVLGEGTFLDLLKFVERHAPDAPTADLVRRARNDESRHVHFGLAHVRHALAHDATLYGRLEAAVRKRAAVMSSAGGVPGPLADALTILAAGGMQPRAVRKGHAAFRDLLDEMHENRAKRLQHAGFTPAQAKTLSDLHTPNFM